MVTTYHTLRAIFPHKNHECLPWVTNVFGRHLSPGTPYNRPACIDSRCMVLSEKKLGKNWHIFFLSHVELNMGQKCVIFVINC